MLVAWLNQFSEMFTGLWDHLCNVFGSSSGDVERISDRCVLCRRFLDILSYLIFLWQRALSTDFSRAATRMWYEGIEPFGSEPPHLETIARASVAPRNVSREEVDSSFLKSVVAINNINSVTILQEAPRKRPGAVLNNHAHEVKHATRWCVGGRVGDAILHFLECVYLRCKFWQNWMSAGNPDTSPTQGQHEVQSANKCSRVSNIS